MIRRIDLRDAPAGRSSGSDYRSAVPRAPFDVELAIDVVRPICDDVRHRGVEAIQKWSRDLDGVDLTQIDVPAEALAEALAALDPQVAGALEESIARLRRTCEAELETC